MLGREVARHVIEEHGSSDPEAIVKAEGLEVCSIPLWKARFQEFFVEPLILIPRGIDNRRRRTLVAHSLGHHFMHVGNQIWFRGIDRIWNRRQEHQAEEFAAYLIIPEGDEVWLPNLLDAEVARMYKVTEDLVRVRRGA